MKMMREIIQQDNLLDDSKVGNLTNYHKLVQKLSTKTKKDNEIKKERHVMKKKFAETKV